MSCGYFSMKCKKIPPFMTEEDSYYKQKKRGFMLKILHTRAPIRVRNDCVKSQRNDASHFFFIYWGWVRHFQRAWLRLGMDKIHV